MFWHRSTRTRQNQDDEHLVTNDPYRFQPLSASTTIRLIKIFPERVQGCIACTMFHFNEQQQEAIKYHALSYFWGDPAPKRQIYLQDEGNQGNEWRPFPLHENLWQFLYHTWRSQIYDQLFWTDYLCLDQKGHEEIAQQVPRMHAIYRNAELVVIWLQLDWYERNALYKLVEQKALRKLVERVDRPKLRPKVVRRKLQKRLSSYQDGMRRAMNNRYWRRIWIVQEVVVAKKVRVITANMSIDLDELRVLLDSYVDAGNWAQRPSMWLLCDMRAVGGKIPLWRILRDFAKHESSHPVDRVFGMLGIVEDHEDGSSPAENIQVDYEKLIWQVLLDAMFESSPPLEEYRMMTNCLDEFEIGFSLLKSYIRRETMERHRDLARIALQASEAFKIITWNPWERRARDRVSDLMDDLFSAAAEWRPTLRQNAALIGLMMSSWNRGPLPRWKLQGQVLDGGDWVSHWRCAAHGSRNGGHPGLGSYELVADVSTWYWDRRLIVDACGRRSRRCRGPTIACEISDIGLRLQVEPAISPAHASHFRLYCVRFQA